MFLDVLDQHAALKEKRVKQPKQPERITDAYHFAMVKQAKSEYFKSHIENNAHDSKTMWNYLLALAAHFILGHHSPSHLRAIQLANLSMYQVLLTNTLSA